MSNKVYTSFSWSKEYVTYAFNDTLNKITVPKYLIYSIFLRTSYFEGIQKWILKNINWKNSGFAQLRVTISNLHG